MKGGDSSRFKELTRHRPALPTPEGVGLRHGNRSKHTRAKISEAHEVYVSSASIWEATIKIKLKKLEAKVDDLIDAISESGFLELPITARHAAAVATLDEIHRDPFDRILIAQAISEPLTFLTADELLKSYSDLVELGSVLKRLN